MNTTTISRKTLRQFSAFSAAFGQDQTPFKPFLQRPFTAISDLYQQIQLKQADYSPEKRAVLVAELERQLGNTLSESQRKNLSLLKQQTTFTITTGHQLTLFGGPMFLLYKVLHAVKLSEQFNAESETLKTVPVFWLASEDHDVDEIRSAPLFNRLLTWETTQKGPVGRFSLDDYRTVLEEFRLLFDKGEDNELLQLLENLPLNDYRTHYQQLMMRLFRDFGVLVIQPDSRELKQLFLPVIQRELKEKAAFQAVQERNAELEKAGLNPQAQARECNLFLLDETGRHRIDPSANGFTVDGKTYTTDELIRFSEQHPEAFSPNVILRPLYQETILPNLVYIGGGGEMAYWIQLKGVFDRYGVIYPLLQQRNSLSLIDSGTAKRMEKLQWETIRFFEPKEQLRKAYLQEHDAGQLDVSIVNEQFENLKLAMIEKARSVDVSLESFAEAETVRMSKQLESYEQRLVKHIKQQHEQALKSIDAICDRFVPSGELQERYFHWLNFAPSGNFRPLLDSLHAAMDPFEGDLIVVELKN
jgi:bacillithiol biosynthesis cysteine-adding enzyme BshC